MAESAASTLRLARIRAGMTQGELATRARVSQSVISAYESGTREPSFTMLNKIVAAAGFSIELSLQSRPPATPLRRSVDDNRVQLVRSLRRLGARNIRIFGSVARGDDRPDSDIDLLVDVTPRVGLFALGQMRSEAERILGAPVDIVPANSLKPDVAAHIAAEAVAL
jgi:uncharacterized protein